MSDTQRPEAETDTRGGYDAARLVEIRREVADFEAHYPRTVAYTVSALRELLDMLDAVQGCAERALTELDAAMAADDDLTQMGHLLAVQGLLVVASPTAAAGDER